MEKSTKGQTILQLKQVSKIYQLGEQIIKALDKVDFTVHEGEFIAIMGPSGSGKSTLLQVASILAQASKGQIFLKGKDVTEYNEAESARLRNQEIGFIFQKFNLLSKTSAVDNVALPLVYANVAAEERRARAKAVLEKLNMGDRLKNKPSQLSGGQQQRVAIARALVNEPAIIFADEPTGNLDTKSGEEVENILKQLNDEGKTIIMVTHEADVAKIAGRLVFLRDGQIVADSENGHSKNGRKGKRKNGKRKKKISEIKKLAGIE